MDVGVVQFGNAGYHHVMMTRKQKYNCNNVNGKVEKLVKVKAQPF